MFIDEYHIVDQYHLPNLVIILQILDVVGSNNSSFDIPPFGVPIDINEWCIIIRHYVFT